MEDKFKRLEIVNKIIQEISVRGRRFFYHDGKTAELALFNGKVWYKAEFGRIEMVCLSVPSYRTPKGWFHGGTLLSLVLDFRDYVLRGEQKEYPSYGGLHCPHWGYPESDMIEIRNKAKKLGFL